MRKGNKIREMAPQLGQKQKGLKEGDRSGILAQAGQGQSPPGKRSGTGSPKCILGSAGGEAPPCRLPAGLCCPLLALATVLQREEKAKTRRL